jgi:ABC-type nitrate/sulfonate/bicarbonate transport system permease component
VTAAARVQALPRTRAGSLLLGGVGVLLALALWQVAPAIGLVPGDDIPPAGDVLSKLVELLGTSGFWSATGATLAGAGIGLAIAVVAGVALGVLMGSSKVAWHALRPTVEFLRPVPGVALIPVAILVFGPSLEGDVLLVAFGCLWPMLVQTLYGVRAVDEVALATARSYGLNGWERVRFVQLPSALPYIATGLRISSAIALIVAVTAELVAGNTGLGDSIALAQSAGQTEEMYALIVTAGILGVIVHVVFAAFERRLLHWHQSQRAGVEG